MRRPLASPAMSLVALALFLGSGCSDREPTATDDGTGSSQAQQPNVLLIVIDTLRKDHLSAYGYERKTSPALDLLSASGIRYDGAIAQAPWTTPSIGALMTSMYPSALGIEGEQNALADALVLLPEALLEAGYQTAGVISHSFLGSAWNFQQGFQVFDEGNVQGHSAVTSEGVTRDATALLRQLSQDEAPFFLFVHYFDPHAAYVEHESHDFGGPQGYVGDVESGLLFRELRRMEGTTDEADLAEIIRLYDSEIAFTDRQIGLLLDELRATGEFDDTLIIVTADHGEEFLDHKKFGHTKSLFDELINVPLIIKPPASMELEPAVVEEPVALIDVYPTILGAASIPVAKELAGRPLLPEAPTERILFSETGRVRSSIAAIQGTFKYIEHANGRTRLFDRASDPNEKASVLAEHPELVDSLKNALTTWRSTVDAKVQRGEKVELDDDATQRMKELGYGGDDH